MKRDREAIYKKCDGHCAYCGQVITIKVMQVDHYYPKCDPKRAHDNGVIDIDYIDNLMPSCPQCNHYKRAQSPKVWRATMATLHERVQKIYIHRVAVNFGMANIRPWDGLFYFEKIQQDETE